MKLAVTVKLDVDIVAWGDQYDVRGTQDIKIDVARYVLALIAASNAFGNKAITDVDVTNVVEKRL